MKTWVRAAHGAPDDEAADGVCGRGGEVGREGETG